MKVPGGLPPIGPERGPSPVNPAKKAGDAKQSNSGASGNDHVQISEEARQLHEASQSRDAGGSGSDSGDSKQTSPEEIQRRIVGDHYDTSEVAYAIADALLDIYGI